MVRLDGCPAWRFSAPVLTGPQRKFCEGIVAGKNGTEAYCGAYPESSVEAGRKNAPRLMSNDGIKAEIQRMRDKADTKAGSSVLTLMEKRQWIARLLRADLSENVDGDLWAGVDREQKRGEGNEDVEIVKIRLPDKIRAMELDNDLAGEGSEAAANDALRGLLERVRQ